MTKWAWIPGMLRLAPTQYVFIIIGTQSLACPEAKPSHHYRCEGNVAGRGTVHTAGTPIHSQNGTKNKSSVYIDTSSIHFNTIKTHIHTLHFNHIQYPDDACYPHKTSKGCSNKLR